MKTICRNDLRAKQVEQECRADMNFRRRTAGEETPESRRAAPALLPQEGLGNVMDAQTRQYASWLLSSLYSQLDMLCENEADLGEGLQPVLQSIEQAETVYGAFLQPCHLCRKQTIFKDDAFDLPFCWPCLQRDYHFWYRSEVYAKGADRVRETSPERRTSTADASEPLRRAAFHQSASEPSSA